MTTYHRGAAVSQRISLAEYFGQQVARTFCGAYGWQWDCLRDKSKELTGAQLAAASKPSRQRRKGPIVRFGRAS